MDLRNAEYFLDIIRKENDGKHIDFALPGYAGRHLVGYQSMRGDLILCTEAAMQFAKHVEDETISLCILHTITILYGKCFTESKKYPRLDPNVYFKGQYEHFRELHDELMQLRHNLSAHRGTTEYDLGFPYLKLNIEDLSREVRVQQLKRRRPPAERIQQYLQLFQFLIGIVEECFEGAANKVWDHMLKNFSAEELALLKIAGPTSNELKPEV